MANRYPGRLMEHLRQLGDEEDMNLRNSDSDVARKWKFTKTDDNGEADEECPCGKKEIRYLMYIKHKNTGNEIFVGSSCIKLFERCLENLTNVALALMQTGVKGTYKGVTKRNPRQLKFKIPPNHGFVRNLNDFRVHIIYVPVSQLEYNDWNCEVFPPDRDKIEEYARKLVIGQQYQLKVKLTRWENDDGNSFSLFITARVQIVVTS